MFYGNTLNYGTYFQILTMLLLIEHDMRCTTCPWWNVLQVTSCRQVYWPWGGTTFSSPFISTLILSLMAPETADLSVLLSETNRQSGSVSFVQVHLSITVLANLDKSQSGEMGLGWSLTAGFEILTTTVTTPQILSFSTNVNHSLLYSHRQFTRNCHLRSFG